MHNGPMNILVQVLVWTQVFASLKYIPRRALLGHSLLVFKFFILVTLVEVPNLCSCCIAGISDVNMVNFFFFN